ncbi:hypothetical protein [Candidatus Pantoea deserta]|uniref:hypothetical protein n=1 Tax=Candidatus Pantoea deserta TaxID=1869313 RepID=UPI00131A2865|nr:hypothetical protein [Pantoea deserta]
MKKQPQGCFFMGEKQTISQFHRWANLPIMRLCLTGFKPFSPTSRPFSQITGLDKK